MAYTTINKSSEHFNTKLYTGTGSTASITGVGFQPDFSWIKVRNNSDQHVIFDAVRGATKRLEPSTAIAEATISDELTAFNSDGFSIGGADRVNRNNDTYVSWNWKANGQGSSNTAGSINTTYTSVNTTAGFSISKYTGTGSSGDTVGHGLGAVPKMIIIKRLTSTRDWGVYHGSLGATKYLELNNTQAAATDNGYWNNTEPTSNLITFGNDGQVNGGGDPLIMYAFAEKTGYSKFGSYVGNGNVNGTFIYTGFAPAFFMLKRTDGTNSWRMWDNKRDPFNVRDTSINANESGAEYTDASVYMDFVSNGVKFRTTGDNISGANYIYMAFAAAPLVGTNNVPCTAR